MEVKTLEHGDYTLYNLTPHNITIATDRGNIIVEPSGVVARVEEHRFNVGKIGGIDVTRVKLGHVVFVDNDGVEVFAPCPRDGGYDVYIVSAMCLQALKGISNGFFSPGKLIRNAEGQPIGCEGLTQI